MYTKSSNYIRYSTKTNIGKLNSLSTPNISENIVTLYFIKLFNSIYESVVQL